MSISVKKDEWTPFGKNLSKSHNGLMKIVPRTCGRIADIWLGQARRFSQLLKRHTGTYFKSFYREGVKGRGKSVSVEFGNEANYAGYIEHGTKPHMIFPRADRAPASVLATGKLRSRPGALAWLSGGNMIFAKKVKHPGTRAYKILETAINSPSSHALVEKEIDTAIKKQLERLSV